MNKIINLKEIILQIDNPKSFSSVIDYIIKKFHNPSRNILIEIEETIDHLYKKYSWKYPELAQVKELFNQYHNIYIKHINREEDILFPKIKKLEEKLKNNEKIDEKEFLEIEIEIKKQNIEHEEFEIYWANFLGILLNSKIMEENVKEYKDLVIKLEDFKIEAIKHSKLESYHLDLLVLNSKKDLL